MLIAHLNTGIRKGVIVTLKNTKITNKEDIVELAITKGFNRAMELDLTTREVMSKHFINMYDTIIYKENNTFDLAKIYTEYSLGHRIESYVFVEESLSVAEVDTKKYDRIVAIDFETANSKRASVCAIGFVVEENGEKIVEKEILVNPKTEFSNMCMRVHGIKPLDVVGAPTWDEAWIEVEKYITPSTLVVAHNLRSMELSCIRQECERYNMTVPKFAEIRSKMAYDTLKMAKETIEKEDIENYKLNTLCEKFDIALEHHNALSDARACLELFHHLRGEYSLA